jgi:hypothetical protein
VVGRVHVEVLRTLWSRSDAALPGAPTPGR